MKRKLYSTQKAALAAIALVSLLGCSSQSLSVLHDAATPPAAAAATADTSPGAAGPYTSIFEQDYQTPAAVDADVIADRETEVWGRLYMPAADTAKGPLPLLVFLHGNHPTCGHGTNPRVDDRSDYTTTGTCPDGYVVTPNHRGYDYLARNMASWGFAVISINANRGITAGRGVAEDSGLNLARGRLVLKHLALLSQMNAGTADSTRLFGIDLKGRLDFDQVGMMGHSRGGEGVRAALAQYQDVGSPWPSRIGKLNVRGIFEIAPVDGQTSRTLNAMNTAWNVMIGLCDGDVSNFQGVKPFDRMLHETTEAVQLPKSTFLVWGANHNFFNTEWQTSDSKGCDDHTPIFDPSQIGSPTQRTIALTALGAFFRHYVGGENDPALARMLDPSTALPTSLTSLDSFGRDFVLTPDASKTLRLVDANTPAAFAGTINGATRSTAEMPFDVGRSGVQIDWSAAGSDASFPLDAATDLSKAATLDLDLESGDTADFIDFDVQLTDAAGVSAAVSLKSVMDVRGATGRNLFQSIRFPLAGFTGVKLDQITGIKLVFDKTPQGTVVLGSIRASTSAAPALSTGPILDGAAHLTAAAAPAKPFVGSGSVVDAALGAAGGSGPDGQPQVPMVAVTVHSQDGFPVRSQQPVLRIGNKAYDLSGYAAATQDTLVFEMPAADFKALQGGESVVVSYGDLATTTYVINAGQLSADIVSGVQ